MSRPGKWIREYFGAKAARLRANGNPAAAASLMARWHLIEADLPTLEAKGERKGRAPRIQATEEVPPPKVEKVNKQFVRRADQ